ncbi:hypothetical protein VE01_02565 [Pseudogymnoascus verrucosus]|uniref:DUF5672 domain-containing protein n=1 Tax=Pseudogymnoascus verrucosus TaxID=342668 RepID=A0A1B8GTJ3_9PEZI|nr:uncharacterized protein VE01_02565 [Pseudogymnoascus verrucosus]OBT99147.1 hypothetical protein VE01_02565 [Pseudogymnoascus verrucosus]
MNPIWHSKRVQRSAFFIFIFIAAIALFAYGGDNLPSASGVFRSGSLSKGEKEQKANEPLGPNVEPLYSGSEYDTEHMPKIPETPHTGQGAATVAPGLDPKRIALIIETRPTNVLPPLLTHFIATLPPAWVVKLVGSQEAFAVVHKSYSLKQHIASKKLQLQELPSYYPVDSSESISQTLTNVTFYSEFLAPAEWALFFQTDSIICSASEQNIDDWVAKGYDWTGAPWNGDVPGGNGGLSLRHIPPIIEVLKKDSREPGHRQWEDTWVCERLKNAAPAQEEKYFSVESLYVERPLGYHIRGSGKLQDPIVWGNATRRRQIFDYCPETKILLGNMKMMSMDDAADLKKEQAADAEKARKDAEDAKKEAEKPKTEEKANTEEKPKTEETPKADDAAAASVKDKKIATDDKKPATEGEKKSSSTTTAAASTSSAKAKETTSQTSAANPAKTSGSTDYADS